MRQATFRQLEVFAAVARLGSYSRAAEALHLTQPSVSIQIKRLSEIVGLPLFEQAGKRMLLTQAGTALESARRDVFNRIEGFETEVSALRGLRQGVLRFGVVNTAQYVAPMLIAPFCAQHPGVEVILEVDNDERLLSRMRNNMDSVYIFSVPPKLVGVHSEFFMRNPLVPLAHAEHPLAGQQNIPLARFSKEAFITREVGSETRRTVERLFVEQHLPFKVRMVISRSEAIKEAVAQGIGVTVLSSHALRTDHEDITVLDVEQFPLEHRWYVVHRLDRDLSLVAKSFLDYLLSDGRDIVANLDEGKLTD